ncbi:MAG: hypothetical protein V1709_03855, partial [Planctomycetota bacterium]
LRVTGTYGSITSGSGMEIYAQSILSYNRTAGAYLAMTIADSITIAAGATANRNVGIGFTAPLSGLCVDSLHVGSESAAGANNLLVDGTLHCDGVATLASVVCEGNATANSMGLIQGDATGGRVLRVIKINITDGTNATTIKPSSVSLWNGDANVAEDNLGKGGDTGVFTLSVNGMLLGLEGAGISGNPIAILSTDVSYNGSGVAVTVYGYVSGNMYFEFRGISSGAVADLTTLVDTDDLELVVAYLTSA